jgi:hypothetical protein
MQNRKRQAREYEILHYRCAKATRIHEGACVYEVIKLAGADTPTPFMHLVLHAGETRVQLRSDLVYSNQSYQRVADMHAGLKSTN